MEDAARRVVEGGRVIVEVTRTVLVGAASRVEGFAVGVLVDAEVAGRIEVAVVGLEFAREVEVRAEVARMVGCRLAVAVNEFVVDRLTVLLEASTEDSS